MDTDRLTVEIDGLSQWLFGESETLQKKHWTHQNITCKSPCKRLVINQKKNKCFCGRDKLYHSEEAKEKGDSDPDTPWTSASDVDNVPTLGYGKIRFVSDDTDVTPDFVRISDDMMTTREGIKKIEDLMTLEELWGMDEHRQPNLLISVTGGAGDFDISPALRANFARGLCEAAKSANAWIVTGGTDTGVMKLVGDAVYNFPGEITLIGIVTWGIIANKEILMRNPTTDRDSVNKSTQATFDYTTGPKKPGIAALNPHHTHFFLVDNGTECTFGGEIEFRSKLEKRITQYYPISKRDKNECIPTILIIVNGGPNSAKTCLTSMNEDIPVLVIKGSGNAADIIAKAHALSDSNNGLRSLSPYAERMVIEDIAMKFPKLPESEHQNILYYCKAVIVKDHLLTIYSLESKDLDHAILYALIKSKTENDSATEKMIMAIKWNRPGLGEEILQGTTGGVEHQFDDVQLMEMAILFNKEKFIPLLVENTKDFEMKKFLTYTRLKNFYRHEPDGSLHLGKKRFFKVMARVVPKFRNQRKDLDIELKDVGDLLKYILGGGFKNPFKKIDSTETIEQYMENPYDMLMIYCALNGMNSMAELMWTYTHSPITTALICTRIYQFHSEFTCNLTAYDNESEQQCLTEAEKYENYACKSLTQCPQLFDKDETFLLLSTKHRFWGQTILNIAYMLKNEQFLAHGAVQNYLTDVWIGKIKSSESYMKIVFCSWLIFPLLLNYKERDKTREEIESMLIKEQAEKKMLRIDSHNQDIEMRNLNEEQKKSPFKFIKSKKRSRDSLENKRKDHLSWSQKMIACYKAPVVKFQWYSFWFVVFIFSYAWTLTEDHHNNCAVTKWSSISYVDIWICIWIIGTIPTEINQLLKEPALQFVSKVINHFSSFYNMVDGLAVLTYFISFIIKVSTAPISSEDRDNSALFIGKHAHEHTTTCPYLLPFVNTFYNEELNAYNIAHFFNIISFMMYVLKAMEFFKLSAEMGPKVVMVFQMIKDLVFFIVLLLLFVFAYSVGAQALVRPNKSLSPLTGDYFFHLLFYRPYLMAMGEFDTAQYIEDFLIDHCNASDPDNLLKGCGEDDDWNDLLDVNTIARFHYYTFVVLTIIYIMIANILLVNLLIAIFSSTYERLQENSKQLYLSQRAELILQFDERTILPNPFSIPEHVWRFCKWIKTWCKGVKKGDQSDPGYHKMTKIERACCDGFALIKDEEDDDYVKDQLKSLKESLQNVKNMLDNTSFGAGVEAPAPRQRQPSPHHLEVTQQMRRSPSPSRHSEVCPLPSIEAAAAAATAFKRLAVSEKPVEIHVDSRRSPYPHTDIVRAEVPDDKVPWQLGWEDYSPVEFTKGRKGAGKSGKKSTNYDGEALSVEIVASFNRFADGINRKSFLGYYTINAQGRPINPRGRTGMSGKGNLKRWGPNHQGDVVVTRWLTDEDDVYVEHPEDGRKILQFVAVRKRGQWAIPGGRADENTKLVDVLEKEFCEEALGTLDMTEEKKKKAMRMVDKHFGLGINVYQGYVDDPNNTDNAWYETTALNYHDSDGSSFSKFQLSGENTDEDKIDEGNVSKWITLDQNIDLYANHEEIMQKVCFHRNAYCPIQDDANLVEVGSGKVLKKKKSARWGIIIAPERS